MMKMKKSIRVSLGLILLTVLTAMIFSANVHKAWSYFTTFCTAAGGYTLELGDRTTIEEDFENKEKHVRITNSPDSDQAVFVRARAFWGAEYNDQFKYIPSAKWKKMDELAYSWDPVKDEDDQYYYYDQVLEPGETSDDLVVHIGDLPKPEKEGDATSINVAVVYETTPALYNADGSAYADWNMKFDITKISE